MKKTVITLSIVFLGGFIYSQNLLSHNENNKSPEIINALDSVIFDLSNSITTSNYVEFPISIKSDDIVNALDFSLKFNYANFTFDSTINLTSYISSNGHFTTSDSTLRFTSNSLTTYRNDTSLVSIRLYRPGGLTCSNINLHSITVYLNGDPCSYGIKNCITTGISDETNMGKSVNVFPNPAKDFLYVETEVSADIELIDILGRELIPKTSLIANQEKEINIHIIPNGIYFLRLFSANFSSTKKIVINR